MTSPSRTTGRDIRRHKASNYPARPAPAHVQAFAALMTGRRALRRNKGFRMLWIGQLLSDTGTKT